MAFGVASLADAALVHKNDAGFCLLLDEGATSIGAQVALAQTPTTRPSMPSVPSVPRGVPPGPEEQEALFHPRGREPSAAQPLCVGSHVIHVASAYRASMTVSVGIVLGLGHCPVSRLLAPHVAAASRATLRSHAILHDAGMVAPLAYALVLAATDVEERDGGSFLIRAASVFNVPVRDLRSKWKPLRALRATQGPPTAALDVLHELHAKALKAGFLKPSTCAAALKAAAENRAALRLSAAWRGTIARRNLARGRSCLRRAEEQAEEGGGGGDGAATLDGMAALLGDIAPDWLLDLNSHPAAVPVASDWATMRLVAARDRAMQKAAVLHSRLNASLLDVLVVLRDEGDEGGVDARGEDSAATAPRVYLNALPGASVAVELATSLILAPFSDETIWRVAWVLEGESALQLQQGDFEEFLHTTKSNLYASRLPYDPTKRPYHTLVAVGPPPEERIVGFVTLRTCLATSPFGTAGALMPVIVIDLIATDPSIRGGGLGGALLKLAIAACFERGRGRPHGGYLLTEAVSTGPGWQFWQSRVTRKDPLAISLAIQLICGVAQGVLTESALPCGTILFPEPPPSSDA